MAVLVVNTNLAAGSSTESLARHAADAIARHGAEADLLDLAARPMPWCDGRACYEDPVTKDLTAAVRRAEGVVLCTPIYNYTINAALKNFIELTDKAWTDKTVGFACSAGGHASYMAIMQAATWLMLDHRCLIVPRFVYATRSAFTERKLTDEEAIRRMDELAIEVVRVSRLLAKH